MGHVLGILSRLAGVGKTATAVNLAVLLARGGHRTLLVDLGHGADASRQFGIEAVPSAGPIPAGDRPDLELLPLALTAAPATPDWERLAAGRDYVVADLPLMETLRDDHLMGLAGVILVVPASQLSLSELAGVTQVLAEVKHRHPAKLVVKGVLVTLAGGDLSDFETLLATAARTFPLDFFPCPIPRDARFRPDLARGLAAVEAAPESRATRGYVELTLEVLNHG